ncbi:hypothetical protein SDC9_186418 [bioreactor metagenome]|uniref:Uncharacterized protein n=1 Tax=bioreactor metagenome TaxID=1076179 RepID=A0A645HU40_9ZZZZ
MQSARAVIQRFQFAHADIARQRASLSIRQRGLKREFPSCRAFVQIGCVYMRTRQGNEAAAAHKANAAVAHARKPELAIAHQHGEQR